MDPTDYFSVLEDDLTDLLITMSMLSFDNNGTLEMDTMPDVLNGNLTQNKILHQQQQQPGTSQQSGGGTAGGSSGGNTGSGSSGGGQHLSEERKIQQQLVLLLHAHKCNRLESLNPNREKCIAPYCKPMKDVLAHMVNCKQSIECSFQHCTSSRQILLHYKTCTRSDCIICFPFRQQQPPQMGPNPQENAQAGVMGGPRPPQTGGGPHQNQILHQQQQQPGTSQQSGGGTAGGTAGGSSGENTGSGSSGGGQHLSEERKIQQQLVLLLHAHKCNRLESLNPNREKCIAPYCKPMKDVLAHMANCKQSKECSVQHCTSSRQILLHYKTCTRSDCIICFPFRQQQTSQGCNDSASNNAGTEERDWRESVTADLRIHLVHKLVQAIFPTSDPTTMADKRMANVVSYAEKVEKDMYGAAKSRSEYYYLMAEKIHKMQKELEEKRIKRKEQQMLIMQQQQQGSGGGAGSK